MKFFITLFLVISLYSQVIDKIAVLVNDVPITTYDIQKIQTKLHLNKQEAIDYLINQAILQSAIKKRDIYVDEFDVDNAMENIAKRNGMSLFEFKTYLIQKGQLEEFEKKLKKDLEKQKLLDSLNINISQDKIKEYYETHKEEFEVPQIIQTTEYSSKSREELIKAIKNPLSDNLNITIKDVTFYANKTNPRLMRFLSRYEEKTFTPIIEISNQYSSFYILKKSNLKPLSFEEVAPQIYQILLAQEKQKALQNLLEKLKAKADIKFLIKE